MEMPAVDAGNPYAGVVRPISRCDVLHVRERLA